VLPAADHGLRADDGLSDRVLAVVDLTGVSNMNTVIRVSQRDSAKAWALLVRHSPGVALPDRVFVVSDEAVRALRRAGIRFTELSREAGVSGAAAGERI